MRHTNNQWSTPFRYTVGIFCFIGLVALLIYAREAVKALVIAGFVSYLIMPAVSLLMKKTRLTRTAAVNIIYFSSLVIMVGVPATVTPIFFDEAQVVVKDVLDLAQQISQTLSEPVVIGPTVFHFEQLGEGLAHIQDTALSPLPEEVLALLETTSISIIWFLVIVVSVYIFMMEWPKIREWMIDFSPPAYHDDVKELYRRIRRIWMAYLRGQIVLMLIVGIVFTVAWLIVGIPGALVLGVLTGLFTLVPDVGPFVGVAITVGVALLEGSTWIKISEDPTTNNFWVAGIVIAVYLVLINAKNLFLRPYIMGRSVHMNEALVFIVIMIATVLEGIIGALLVVPVLASAFVIAEYVRRRLLLLPPFEDDGEKQFTAPPEKIKSPRRLKLPQKNKKQAP
jgi:predicted PurR-regulated permease PerM